MIEQFNQYLSQLIDNNSSINSAMNYSLLQTGKRLRPLLLFAALNDYAYPVEAGFPAAAALEMIHTYSLIHDDLPAMDNDDYRRGLLTNHKVYGEAMAILAGDGLLTKAFEIIAKSNYNASQKELLSLKMSQAAGAAGLILGQTLDINHNQTTVTINDLENIHRHKTGQLFALSLMMAAIIAKEQQDLDLLADLGSAIGLAFQIQDDVLESTANYELLGKLPSDERLNKTNYVSLLGLPAAKNALKVAYKQCYNMLKQLPTATHLTELLNQMEERTY